MSRADAFPGSNVVDDVQLSAAEGVSPLTKGIRDALSSHHRHTSWHEEQSRLVEDEGMNSYRVQEDDSNLTTQPIGVSFPIHSIMKEAGYNYLRTKYNQSVEVQKQRPGFSGLTDRCRYYLHRFRSFQTWRLGLMLFITIITQATFGAIFGGWQHWKLLLRADGVVTKPCQDLPSPEEIHLCEESRLGSLYVLASAADNMIALLAGIILDAIGSYWVVNFAWLCSFTGAFLLILGSFFEIESIALWRGAFYLLGSCGGQFNFGLMDLANRFPADYRFVVLNFIVVFQVMSPLTVKFLYMIWGRMGQPSLWIIAVLHWGAVGIPLCLGYIILFDNHHILAPDDASIVTGRTLNPLRSYYFHSWGSFETFTCLSTVSHTHQDPSWLEFHPEPHHRHNHDQMTSTVISGSQWSTTSRLYQAASDEAAENYRHAAQPQSPNNNKIPEPITEGTTEGTTETASDGAVASESLPYTAMPTSLDVIRPGSATPAIEVDDEYDGPILLDGHYAQTFGQSCAIPRSQHPDGDREVIIDLDHEPTITTTLTTSSLQPRRPSWRSDVLEPMVREAKRFCHPQLMAMVWGFFVPGVIGKDLYWLNLMEDTSPEFATTISAVFPFIALSAAFTAGPLYQLKPPYSILLVSLMVVVMQSISHLSTLRNDNMALLWVGAILYSVTVQNVTTARFCYIKWLLVNNYGVVAGLTSFAAGCGVMSLSVFKSYPALDALLTIYYRYINIYLGLGTTIGLCVSHALNSRKARKADKEESKFRGELIPRRMRVGGTQASPCIV